MALEKQIEGRVVAYAQRRGVFVTKLAAPGHRGLPDRAFWLGGGRPLLVEFKRPGGRTTALQQHIIDKLKGLGYDCYTIDSYEAGVALINSKLLTVHTGGALASTRLSAKRD